MINISMNKVIFFYFLIKTALFLLKNKAVLKDYLLNMSFKAFAGKNLTF